jgi:hypothetical protein
VREPQIFVAECHAPVDAGLCSQLGMERWRIFEFYDASHAVNTRGGNLGVETFPDRVDDRRGGYSRSLHRSKFNEVNNLVGNDSWPSSQRRMRGVS